ncbi:Sec-independent protein translocase subunit TatA [Arthrobacter burdickii]|uniref:Sec-independent protein translocase protein TatA n=1 Tax=Arthrobacter burdickii TaxID=3035920 RepID=A0ABT8K2E6_9MICC|nr:Sec-independent protein translocase subunit TatA [Arthrobacter burdickii]MDN4611603.1 Sec-independent protein translocase subunit TatA [Arthrobacter burdickii]
MRLEGWHIVIIIVLAIVLFGAPKLPGLARSVGQSLRIFKSEVKQMKDENNTPDAGTDPVEGRVVDSGRPQSHTPTYETPVQNPAPDQNPGQQAPRYQDGAAGSGPVDGSSGTQSQAGPPQHGGTSTTPQ